MKSISSHHSVDRAPLCLCAFVVVVLTFNIAFAQIDDARQAIEKGEYVRAINILSELLVNRPTADVYLNLARAYDRTKEFQKAEDTLKEGSRRYPKDSRFYNELADFYLENNDRDAAKSNLRRALTVDPSNNYASDLLATIDMSEGEVQAALRSWNKSSRPVINDILHNYYLTFGSWVVRDAVAFHPSGVLHYSEWKTTESRLRETDIFANVGLEVEPTVVPDQYDAVVRTTTKSNSLRDFVFGLFKGAPVETSYVDLWNLANSGMNFNGNYRWETNRRRVDGRLKIPLPIAGLLHLELGDTWRAERWDLGPVIRPELKGAALLDYKANAMRGHLKYIPDYRVELGAGFEYRNRASKGNLPQLFTDSRNAGKLTGEVNLRLVDRQYQNRLHVEGFAARRSLLGDMNFSGGVAELNNRVTLSRDTRTNLDWNIKAGTSRGALPVEEYFMLGLDTNPTNLLRGHTVTEHGHYGHGPMGTDFALVNTDLERRLATIPFFNTFNIPFFTVKWNLFFDGAKTWDRNRIFQPSKLLLDTGGGVRFETPTHSLNLLYGRSLRDGKNVLYAYVERRLW
jgi:tetratricopeptide (TPR) repeat protein